MRDNPDLDDVINDNFGTGPQRGGLRKRRRSPPKVSRDQVRRLAFRVLATLSGIDADARRRVLNHAMKLSDE